MRQRKLCLRLLLTTLLMSACTAPIVPMQTDEPVVQRAEPPTPLPQSSAAAQQEQTESVKLGYHYKPPQDGTTENELAQEAAFIILTKNDEAYREQLRAAGYQGLVLQYVLANEVEGPAVKKGAKKCDAQYEPWQNQVANQVGDFCNLIHPHEDWFLHNSKGERLYGTDQGRRFYRMNPSNREWRAFALQRLRQALFGDETTAPLGYDGLFLDNVELSMEKSLNELKNSGGKIQEFTTEKEFRTAWREWLKFVRNGLGTTIPIWGNMIAGDQKSDEWNEYLPYLSGGMNEAFATGYNEPLSAEKYANELTQAEHVIAEGKGFYAVSQGKQSDTQRQRFALASFLLIAQPDAANFFRYTEAGEHYDAWWSYSNYTTRLGKPLGSRYRTKNGWRRDWSNGYVEVDVEGRKGRIVQQADEANANATATATP